jgi:hypothetical protein
MGCVQSAVKEKLTLDMLRVKNAALNGEKGGANTIYRPREERNDKVDVVMFDRGVNKFCDAD